MNNNLNDLVKSAQLLINGRFPLNDLMSEYFDKTRSVLVQFYQCKRWEFDEMITTIVLIDEMKAQIFYSKSPITIKKSVDKM